MKKLLFVIFSVLVICNFINISKVEASSLSPLPLISRNVPAYSNNAVYPANNSDSSDYGSPTRIGVPGYLALDLSSVPAAQRQSVMVVWYNDDTYEYDHTIAGSPGYNNLGTYTIDVNAAPGGSAPNTGWVTLVTVTGNHYHSRQHAIDMSGYNWVRISITASDGSAGNTDAAFKMDVYNTAAGISDDWIFYGDSITANIMDHQQENNVNDFSQLINATNPAYFPLQENGGIPYFTSSDGASHIATWLPLFPGKFVDLSYGTNDANGCMDAKTFKQNYTYMIQAVTILGKTPVIPHIPWAPSSSVQQCAPALNAVIDQLYATNPGIIHGPDLWSTFQNHPEWFQDELHPNAVGDGIYRNAWVSAMHQNVYNGNVTFPTPTPTSVVKPTITPTQIPNGGPTPSCTGSIPAGSGVATISNVMLPSAGTYSIFTRMMVPAFGNAYFLQIDKNCPTIISDTTNSKSWDWIVSGTLSYAADTTHTITLYGKDTNVKIDEVLFSQSCIPVGDGSNCSVTSVNPTATFTPTPTDIPISTTTPIPTIQKSGSLTFMKSSSANGNFGTGVSIIIPSSIQAGDLLIALAGSNGQNSIWKIPAGWNKGNGSSTRNAQGLYWFWKTANGTESNTKLQLKSSAYADGGAVVAVYRGASATHPIAGVSSFLSNTNEGSFSVNTAQVNGVTLASRLHVISLVLTSWQQSDSKSTWPHGFIDEAGATDGFGHVELGESLSSFITSSLPSQTLNFSTTQAVIQTIQIAVQLP